MCRLFAFKSVFNSQVHSSLLNTDNALSSQSVKHPDGWGVAYYREEIPHLIKSVDRAMDDQLFHKVSGVVFSDTVLAHIRKATQGDLNILNSHPFQYGQWVFAHNGNLKNYDQYRDKLLAEIDPELRSFILGTTDSEVLFYLLLTLIKKRQALSKVDIRLGALKDVTEELCKIVTSYSGPLYGGDDNDPEESHMTYILTTGKVMVAFHGGQDLNFSTYKTKCSESKTCGYYADSCEAPVKNSEKVNHLIFSSESLQGENIWTKMKKGELIGVDSEMYFSHFQLNVDFTT